MILRKLRTAASLVARFAVKAWARVRNYAKKRGRHYGKRTVWAWKDVAERARNARLALVNHTRKGVESALNLRKPVIRFVRRTERTAKIRAVEREERGVERLAIRLAASDRPLVLGPWISEVGFEVLYWIPFLAWLKTMAQWDSANVIAVSRGGVRSWYHGLSDTYVEIFDCLSPEEFARRNESRREAAEGVHKQMDLSDLDRDLIRLAAQKAGLTDPVVIHPSLMYRLFRFFWLGHRPLIYVEERTRFSRREGPAGLSLHGLPRDYVAVKAYTAQSLPDTPRNRQVLRAIVEQLTRTTNVVTLDTGLALDDHDDYRLDQNPRVFSVANQLTPPNNLEVQTAVIAGASAFVGTCGSLTWLAPMLGVPTVALMSDPRFLRAHLYLARHVYSAIGAANFSTVDVNAVDHLRLDLTPPVGR